MKNFFTYKNIIFSVLAILLVLFLPKISGILLLFFASYVFACALNPYVNKLSKKMNRALAVLTVLALTFISITALFIPLLVIGINEIRSLIATLPSKFTFISEYLQHGSIFGHKIVDLIDLQALDYGSIIGNGSNIAQQVVSQSMNITMGIFQFIVMLLAISMIVLYILNDKEYLKQKFLELFPPDLKGKAKSILTSISERVGGYVRAQILSMIAIGVMVTIVLMLFGVEYPLFLGIISGIMDIVPLLGPAIALGLILLVAYQLGVVKLILIIILFLVIQQISNYLVRPLLFGKFMALHPLTIFLALFLADQFLGFWGVILSPAIAATICVLIDELYIKPINSRNLDIQNE